MKKNLLRIPAVLGCLVLMIVGILNFHIPAHAEESFVLDVSGRIYDGFKGTSSTIKTLKGVGTFDVYINGSKVADDVADYCKTLPKNTSYQIADIKALEKDDDTTALYLYRGSYYYYGTLSSSVNVTLDFDKVSYLDLNGTVNRQYELDLQDAGTCDVYVNGRLIANDVMDYYVRWPVGSTYEIKDIRSRNSYEYIPENSDPISGTIPSGDFWTGVCLHFVQNPFTDISNSDSYYHAVLWALDGGIAGGTSQNTFSPKEACTRYQFAVMLYKLAGKPSVSGVTLPFKDVKTSASYYNAVAWAYNKGIISGTSKTTFSPNDVITRYQAVKMLYKAAGQPAAGSVSNPFKDVSKKSSYYKAVMWAVQNKITSGTSATTFSPNAKCQRYQMVVFLLKFNNLYKIK